jgi:hypothetical protein
MTRRLFGLTITLAAIALVPLLTSKPAPAQTGNQTTISYQVVIQGQQGQSYYFGCGVRPPERATLDWFKQICSAQSADSCGIGCRYFTIQNTGS